MSDLFKAMFGDLVGSGDGPYTHTFTPTNPYPGGCTVLPDPDTDAEWLFCDWWSENDPEEATLVLLGPPSSYTLTIQRGEVPEWEFTYDREARP